jgi:hypothetical protein
MLYLKCGKCSVDLLNHQKFERYMQREPGPYKTDLHAREKRRLGDRLMEMKHSCTVCSWHVQVTLMLHSYWYTERCYSVKTAPLPDISYLHHTHTNEQIIPYHINTDYTVSHKHGSYRIIWTRIIPYNMNIDNTVSHEYGSYRIT